MRITTWGSLLLLAATGCEKDDPLFCQMNPGASGCSQPDGNTTTDDAATDSTGPVDALFCGGTGAYAFCIPPPTTPVNIPAAGATLDTTSTLGCLATPPWTDPTQPDACFVVGTTITIDGLFSISGARPLVLVASETINITGTLDVSSRRGGKTGPGAPSSQCGAFGQMPEDSTNGGGGGAGGSFGTAGGGGGNGDGNQSTPGNTNPSMAGPMVLRAGCNGQNGGTGSGGNGAGGGGRGGGAVYLVAGTSITIASGATINASGAGATRPGQRGGGGGGGSGGMIALYAPAITATGAILMANGGGGSSGGEDTGNGNAQDGADPSNATTQAAGGNGTDNAGDGGDGYADGNDATGGNNGNGGRAGGGGGGGAGVIQSNVTLAGATVSPPS